MNYIVVAFDEYRRKFMHRYFNASSKSEAISDFERHYEDCTVVNIIEL
jgi:hypothetical protein